MKEIAFELKKIRLIVEKQRQEAINLVHELNGVDAATPNKTARDLTREAHAAFSGAMEWLDAMERKARLQIACKDCVFFDEKTQFCPNFEDEDPERKRNFCAECATMEQEIEAMAKESKE